ncbi:ATP synthase F1 subunit delta [bacterium]|nr:ATP synthase F1 subunit delta [bacterium]
MIELSIARRYAKALFDVSLETSTPEAVLSLVLKVADAFGVQHDLLATLSNRFIDINARIKVAEEIALKVGATAEVVNFLKLLIKKGRLTLFPQIRDSFKALVLEHAGKMEARVTTAAALTDAQYNELAGLLSGVTGKQVSIIKDIKEEVLGGIKVYLGGEIYDATIKSQLNKLTENLRKEVFS